jgi:RNA polymerase sigma-70 factor (ECF subfamily)
MKSERRDIQKSMSLHPEPSTGARGRPRTEDRLRLTREEFSARLQTSSRSLWLIAAAVLGHRSDADDVLQEAAMIGLSKIDEFDPETNFAAWMGGIVRNVARNHARKRVRRQTAPADPRTIDQSRTAADEARPSPSFDRRGRMAPDQAVFDDRVLGALNQLEETARACLLLRTLRSLPYREISALLGIPEGTAMSHVHRARQFLRQTLGSPERRPT